MSSPFADPRLATLDGFRVEIDPARERADVILDRPPFNVVSMPQRDQLRLVFEALDEDARVRIIVLRAIGEHFSSGGNIKGFMEAAPEHVSRLAWNIAAPARCAKPVIAANRGYCFGVGFELSLACDFRIVSETCFYALPEQRLGQIPGSGGSARLQKIVGITRTKDIVMRSRRIPAKQAYDWGIATECVPDDDLEAATDALVDELRAFSPLAQRTAKKLLNDTEDANAVDCDRARRPLLQPAAAVGRFPRGRGGIPRQAAGQVQGDLKRGAIDRTSTERTAMKTGTQNWSAPIAVAALAIVLGSSVARAQSYPTRPIQVIVPFAGGSASDVVTRILLDRMRASRSASPSSSTTVRVPAAIPAPSPRPEPPRTATHWWAAVRGRWPPTRRSIAISATTRRRISSRSR